MGCLFPARWRFESDRGADPCLWPQHQLHLTTHDSTLNTKIVYRFHHNQDSAHRGKKFIDGLKGVKESLQL
jgi:hypothetical protein